MDQQLKERLTGAVVLVAAAVVVVPMILSGPREAGDTRGLASPSESSEGRAQDTAPFSSRVVPLAPSSDSIGPAEETGIPEVTQSEQEPLTAPRREVAAVSPQPVPGVEPPPRPAPPASRAAGWVVQLGSFSNAGNARALRDRLQQRGYSAFVESVSRDRGEVTRVFVGPEAQRQDAERAKARLLEETRLKGLVLRYPGG